MGGSRCQDCGNQAKKDCYFLRCRTCCISRGFDCQTHVKSTWTPLSQRQHRHLPEAAAQEHRHHHPRPPTPPQKLKKHRPSSGMVKVGGFPSEFRVSPLFCCVRVRGQDNVGEQYAYQTSVNIGGRVFTGVLYDQGPDDHDRLHQEEEEAAASVLQQQPIVSTNWPPPPPPSAYPSDHPLSVLASAATDSQYFPYPKS